jgi:ubiquinone/menaquinone biosynthesis C-methylase UbiE
LSTKETNQAVFDRDSGAYADLSLKPTERVVLEMMREQLPHMEMLDLGVGAGRTAYTFGALTRRYVGLDYAPGMIEQARAVVGENERLRLIVGDARDLSAVDGPFDFILFSFNGIDAVGHEDRRRVLAEVRRSLKPDGSFLFSTHSLGALPLTPRRRRGRRSSRRQNSQLLEFAKDLRYAALIWRSNRQIDVPAAQQRGWTLVQDPAHGFGLEVYYVDPSEQMRQLREAGLRATKVFDVAGREIDPLLPRRDPWLHYLCRPLPDAA